MTRAFHALERSLRDGPPDENGYVRGPIEFVDEADLRRAASVLSLERVRAADVERRARSAEPSFSLVTAMALAVVVAFGGLAVLSGLGRLSAGADPTPLPSPSGSPGGSGIFVPALTERFVSPRNGFSVSHPLGWRVTPATEPWPANFFLPVGNPAFDDLRHLGDARLNVASQPLEDGQTDADWLASFAHPYQGSAPCGTLPAASPTLQIDGHTAYLVRDGCPMPADQNFSTPDIEFQAIVIADGRVYTIGLDGNVDRAYFDAIVATIRLDPSNAVDS
jgi:hypothetical protein